VINLGGSLNYDKEYARLVKSRSKTDQERQLSVAGEFPACKGLYPDCPEVPSLKENMCRTCPKTDGMKKPRDDEEE